MNLDIQWINCSTQKYQEAETFTIGNYRADVHVELDIDLSLTVVWSIINVKTGELIYGGTKKTTHILSMMNSSPPNIFLECKIEAEKHMFKLMDSMMTEAIEKEVLSD